ncbi:MAG: radical SAM protein [Desulfobacterales bacterium]|nr:radical SAM protein [Deltaproteobacteria bacterium]NNL42006.1 radical SAM protein [Desulfobacterales bacterium]
MESSGFIPDKAKSVLRSHFDATYMQASQHRECHTQKPENRGKPFIIPVFLPNIGCPHQCIFCNQGAITGMKREIPSPEKLHQIVNRFLQHKGKDRDLIQIAFFGGNFLGLRAAHIKSLLHEAGKFVTAGKVDSLRFSTRPDTITNETLDMLDPFPVSTIELGIQSMDDHVLSMSKRGHTSADTQKAVGLLKKRNYEIGLQMMVGLPGDDETKTQLTGRIIVDLSPDFVRIYPTVVLAGSPLARWYQNGKYTPIPLEQCITLVKNLYLLFRKNNIKVIRMGLQASENFATDTEILAGPYHPAFGHLVFSQIFLDMATAILESEVSVRDEVWIKVHPRSISNMRGLKNRNIELLKKKYNIKLITIIPDLSVGKDSLVLNDCLRQY